MISLFSFLLTISILVIIHEFGHYLFARWFKVKVLTFSVGFGPRLISWQGKHNLWCLSLIPLGGYVRMLDEREGPVAPELKAQAFNNKPAYQKLLIAFAGPLFNILFAFAAYYAMGLYGVNELKPVINMTAASPYLTSSQTKLAQNSQILAINQQAVSSWNEAEAVFSTTLTKTNQVNFKLVQSGHSESYLNLDLSRLHQAKTQPSLIDLGFYPLLYTNQISYIEPQSPAAKAGLREGDIVLAINQQAVDSWLNLSEIIRSHPSEQLQFMIKRGDNQLRIAVVPESTTDDNGQIIGKVGIMPTLNTQNLMQNSYIKHYSLVTSFGYAANSCYSMVKSNLTMLLAMVQGKVSWHNLGGPLTIAKASQNALHIGVKAFIDLLALISLGLAVMNLLPIPLLDGGHMLLYALEWISGKPLALETQQLLFKAGLVLVLGLSFLAIYNDILKLLNL